MLHFLLHLRDCRNALRLLKLGMVDRKISIRLDLRRRQASKMYLCLRDMVDRRVAYRLDLCSHLLDFRLKDYHKYRRDMRGGRWKVELAGLMQISMGTLIILSTSFTCWKQISFDKSLGVLGRGVNG